ncbi:MAG: DUF6491 family protein [Caulobacteraceae bacterium]|jgi:hypothetical protein
MSMRSRIVGALAACCAIGALATPALANEQHPCFFINQWQGWHATDANTVYLRVSMKDIYRLDLSAGSQELTWPGSYHLVSVVRGSDSICTPLDLQLAVSDGRGFYQPLIVKTITKLTPDQIDALPKKDRP